MKKSDPGVPLIRRTMPELDALRGIAVLMVVFYHGFFWSNGDGAWTPLPMRLLLAATRVGWLGVDLFFVLSGFLITGILLESRDRPDFYRRFYYRRALRILPAYFALLALLLLFGAAHWRFAVVSSLFAANMVGLLGMTMDYGPLWTLAVEEQWYLLWPTAVRRLSLRGLTLVAGAIAAGSWALRLVAFRYGLTDGLFSYTWFTADGLALGALLAIALRSRYVTRSNTALLAALLVALGVVMLGIGLPYGILTRQSAVGAALQRVPFLLIFAGSLVAILFLGSGRHAHFTQPRVLRFFGEISYGLYLIHLLIFSGYDAALRTFNISDGIPDRPAVAILIRFIVASGVSVLIAYWSRWRFEEWFLRQKNRRFSWRGQTVDAFARSER